MATLNLDVVTGRTVDISITNADGEIEVYKLRGDVPSSILARTLYVQELEQQQPKMDIDFTAPLDFDQIKDFEAKSAEHEAGVQAEMLAVCGAIWRWTDPGMTDAKLSETLTVQQQKDMLSFFFTGLLLRYGKLPQSATSASSQGDSPATSTTTVATTGTVNGRPVASSPSSKGQDSTPLATPSPADSSPADQSSQQDETTTQTADPETETETAASPAAA